MANNTIIQANQQARKWKKIFTKFVSARGLASKIQKEPNKLNVMKTYDQIKYGEQN